MPFNKSHFSRQQRRQAALPPRVEEQQFPHDQHNRHARRILAKRLPPQPTISPADLAWVAGLLEGARVGVTRVAQPSPDFPRRDNHRLRLTVVQTPRVLALLRRNLGGTIERGQWVARGNRAEALLLALYPKLTLAPQATIMALAIQDFRRRNKGISQRAADGLIA